MDTVEILIFKTDIRSRKAMKLLCEVFERIPLITNWSVDTKDIDHVLRIEASGELPEEDVIKLVKMAGFSCEVLPE